MSSISTPLASKTRFGSRLRWAAAALAAGLLVAGCDRAPEGGTNVTPPATSAPSTAPMAPPEPVASAPMSDASATSPAMSPASGASTPQ